MRTQKIHDNYFPQTIGLFSYVRMFTQFVGHSNYQFALYKNTAGELALCKLCRQPQNHMDTYWLVNEIRAYQFFTKYGKQIERISQKTRFPRLHASHVQDGQSYLLIEYVHGKHLIEKDVPTMVTTYLQVVRDLRAISSRLDISQCGVVHRGRTQYCLFFHAYFLLAIMRNPRLTFFLIRNLWHFYAGVIALWSQPEKIFSHRDLGQDNIILSKNRIFVIDFQVSALCNELTEVANVLTTKWKNPVFRKQFLESSMVSEIMSAPTTRNILKAYLFYNAVFRLARGNKKNLHESISVISALGTV